MELEALLRWSWQATKEPDAPLADELAKLGFAVLCQRPKSWGPLVASAASVVEEIERCVVRAGRPFAGYGAGFLQLASVWASQERFGIRRRRLIRRRPPRDTLTATTTHRRTSRAQATLLCRLDAWVPAQEPSEGRAA